MPHPPPFLDLPPEHTAYEGSRVVVLPVPLERTTSYGKGTAEGPAAILRASTQVELYEEQTRSDPFRLGIATLPPFPCGDGEMRDLLAGLEAEAARHLRAGKLLVSLGGEHSLTLGPLRAALAVHGTLGVVQFDAHADLRPEYEGSPFSHACIMSRVVELALPTVAVGIRALSR
ncbi:MAG TPA: arginase family protein, partial [Thermoanaerobaculia bacterium]|nr:arginase family protein [Thermoanaerobaculia bacterium]